MESIVATDPAECAVPEQQCTDEPLLSRNQTQMTAIQSSSSGQKLLEIADQLFKKRFTNANDVSRTSEDECEVKTEFQSLLSNNDQCQNYNDSGSHQLDTNALLHTTLDESGSKTCSNQEPAPTAGSSDMSYIAAYQISLLKGTTDQIQSQPHVSNNQDQENFVNTYSDSSYDYSNKIPIQGLQLPIIKAEDILKCSYQPSSQFSSVNGSYDDSTKSIAQKHPHLSSLISAAPTAHMNTNSHFMDSYSDANATESDNDRTHSELKLVSRHDCSSTAGVIQAPTVNGNASYIGTHPHGNAFTSVCLATESTNVLQPIAITVPFKHTKGYLQTTVEGVEIVVYRSEGHEFVFIKQFQGPGCSSAWVCRMCQHLNKSLQLPLTVPTVRITNLAFNRDPAHPKIAHFCTKPDVVHQLAKNYAELRADVLLPTETPMQHYHPYKLIQQPSLNDDTDVRTGKVRPVAKILPEVQKQQSVATVSSANSSLATGTSDAQKLIISSNQCRYCPKRFISPTELLVHTQRCAQIRPFACDICNRRFKQQATLYHHRRIHSNERPYACISCGKRFIQKSHIDQHMRIHTGEKPYVCHTCGKAFRQKSGLVQHMPVHKVKQEYSVREAQSFLFPDSYDQINDQAAFVI